MSKFITTAIAVVSFVAGLAAGVALLLTGLIPPGRPYTVAQHWKLVDRYREWSARDDMPMSEFGLVANDPLPSLAALEAAGQLEHVDLVFPKVVATRETHQFWMQYVRKHPQIVHASGNPSSPDYSTAGESPLHLDLWFVPSAKPLVQRLITELEDL